MYDSMKYFETIIFDLDGTLIDSAPICREILDRMSTTRGGPSVSLLQVRPFVSIGGAEMIKKVLGSYSLDPKNDINEFREYYASLPTPPESLFPSVLETISWLMAQGFTLGICSNKPQRLCDKVLEDTKLSKYFSTVIGGDILPKSKPDAGHLLETIARMKGNTGKTLYVGDSETDYQTSKNASVPFLFASYGYGNEYEIPPTVPRLKSISFLPEFVQSGTLSNHLIDHKLLKGG